ncbi:MAG: hypothetical protein K2G87_09605 [Oscillospiraceae bacterium]|nr:hypothetical protein [Oscillospiraceae bacterium]
MTDFIRELFDSDMSEVHRSYIPSSIAASAKVKQREISKELTARLDKETLRLFESYCDEHAIYATEELFYSFYCGMKAAFKLFMGVLS